MTIPLQIFATGTSTADAVASIFTPVRARISAIYLTLAVAVGASADIAEQVELSFQSTSQFSTNDASGVLAFVDNSMGLVTSGVFQGNRAAFITNIDIVWEQGQRIYLHFFSSLSTSVNIKALIYTNR